MEEEGIEEKEEIRDIALGSWRVQEVSNALKRTRAGKSGVDEFGPELLRADLEGTAKRLTRCYNRL